MYKPHFRPLSDLVAAMLANSAASLESNAKLDRINGHRTGRGRVTVFTHDNYIHDPRRKWYGLGGRTP